MAMRASRPRCRARPAPDAAPAPSNPSNAGRGLPRPAFFMAGQLPRRRRRQRAEMRPERIQFRVGHRAELAPGHQRVQLPAIRAHAGAHDPEEVVPAPSAQRLRVRREVRGRRCVRDHHQAAPEVGAVAAGADLGQVGAVLGGGRHRRCHAWPGGVVDAGRRGHRELAEQVEHAPERPDHGAPGLVVGSRQRAQPGDDRGGIGVVQVHVVVGRHEDQRRAVRPDAMADGGGDRVVGPRRVAHRAGQVGRDDPRHRARVEQQLPFAGIAMAAGAAAGHVEVAATRDDARVRRHHDRRVGDGVRT